MALSDSKLFALAVEAEELKAESNELAARAKKLRDRILPEMLRRGTKTLGKQDGTVQITLVKPESTVYDQDAILRQIERKHPDLLEQATSLSLTVPLDDVLAWLKSKAPNLYNIAIKRFTTRSLDMSKVARLVQDGELSPKFVARHSRVEPGTPYLRITLREE